MSVRPTKDESADHDDSRPSVHQLILGSNSNKRSKDDHLIIIPNVTQTDGGRSEMVKATVQQSRRSPEGTGYRLVRDGSYSRSDPDSDREAIRIAIKIE